MRDWLDGEKYGGVGARPQYSSRRLEGVDGAEYRPQAHVRGHCARPNAELRGRGLVSADAHDRRLVPAPADEACHIWGNGVQGYYEVTADRYQLESTPDYPHAALMHRVLVRMKHCAVRSAGCQDRRERR